MTNTVKIEIELTPGVWTDITSDVYLRDQLAIARGRSDEQSQTSPQSMVSTLDDRGGKYAPRNPLSPYFGQIGRNTPVRCTVNSSLRFYGEMADLSPKWIQNHADNYIPVQSNGILRRLSQGQPVVSNALRDWVLQQSTLAAYYPLSGGEGTIYSQNIAPGKTGSFQGYGGAIYTYGKDLGAAWLGTGMELNATGDLPYMQGIATASGSNMALDFVFQSAAMGVLDIQIWTGYDQYFNLRLNTSTDTATTQVWWNDGTSITSFVETPAVAALQDTDLHTCRFELRQVAGPTVEWDTYIDAQLVETNSLGLAQTIGGCPFFRFHYSRFTGQTVMNMAHLAFWADNTAANLPAVQSYTDAAFAYTGETAIDRLTRICADGGIPLVTVGTASESMPMGPQFTETRLEQIRDVESTDMGILLEQRDGKGLLYLSRTSLYNQTAAFTLNYAAGQVMPPFEPVDDDQFTRNDVTATRRDGGSARVTMDAGRMSTADPPTGVGRYETEVTVNTETDDQLDAVAGWVLGIGTLDKARWPSVTVNLASRNISSGLATSIRAAEVGDLFTITGLTKAFVYDAVNLIIVGYSETVTPFEHKITFNCMPADPYEVFLVDDTGSRISSGETSQVNASMTTTTTSMSVLSADGSTLWTTSAGDMPIPAMVGGEEVSITAISGTTPGSAQNFTLVRSVNGVVKTHSVGEIVRLKRDASVAL